jgi:hypothetical protein
MISKQIKMFLMVIAFGVGGLFSVCAANKEAVKLGKQYLEKAYESYMNSEMSDTLYEVNLSTDYNTTMEALAFKVQLEYAMGDKNNAYDTLKVGRILYPKDIRVNLLNALILSLECKEGHEILENLEIALNGVKSDLERADILATVEQDNSFEYFRVVCAEQYGTLGEEITRLKQKNVSDDLLKTGTTKWEAKWYGPRLWLSDEACKNVHNGKYVADVVLKFVPNPYKLIVKATLAISDARIKNANKKHRGVILGWSWINAGSATFVVTSQ